MRAAVSAVDRRRDVESASSARARVITDAVLAFGLDTLRRSRRSSMTRRLLLETSSALPPTRVVVELLKMSRQTKSMAACRDFAGAASAIALDDFVLNGQIPAFRSRTS
jgi:c-di-GMP-related signal transduction protein